MTDQQTIDAAREAQRAFKGECEEASCNSELGRYAIGPAWAMYHAIDRLVADLEAARAENERLREGKEYRVLRHDKNWDGSVCPHACYQAEALVWLKMGGQFTSEELAREWAERHAEHVGNLAEDNRILRRDVERLASDLNETRQSHGRLCRAIKRFLGYQNWPAHQGALADFAISRLADHPAASRRGAGEEPGGEGGE